MGVDTFCQCHGSAMHKRKEVEEKTRESVLGRLAELKKETSEQSRKMFVPKKQRGPELDWVFSLSDSNGGVTRPRYISKKESDI